MKLKVPKAKGFKVVIEDSAWEGSGIYQFSVDDTRGPKLICGTVQGRAHAIRCARAVIKLLGGKVR